MDPLVGVGMTLGMASTSHAVGASTSNTIVFVDVLEESNKFDDFEPDDSLVAHVEDPISSTGEFDD